MGMAAQWGHSDMFTALGVYIGLGMVWAAFLKIQQPVSPAMAPTWPETAANVFIWPKGVYTRYFKKML